jgi:hypothetical protein
VTGHFLPPEEIENSQVAINGSNKKFSYRLSFGSYENW